MLSKSVKLPYSPHDACTPAPFHSTPVLDLSHHAAVEAPYRGLYDASYRICGRGVLVDTEEGRKMVTSEGQAARAWEPCGVGSGEVPRVGVP